ncbi:MAG TPA: TonB-dependent receptor, partial [Sphingomicrobium sp.]|nr:TonB-dependent receptor [Sphingomicrobium sp.]
MKLDFRQRLLTTTLLVGAGMIATPALAQSTPPCPAGTVPGNSGACNPADTSGGIGTQPETTTPPAGTVTPPSQNANGAPVTGPQEIIVTGSRIPQPNLETASPVTTVTSQEVKLQGTTRTEDLINSLPQVFADQGSNVTNGATGTAEVDLRGLGSKRTMVLINGRRLMPGDPTDPNPDINFIPNQLIKRVDVLTGGASSVYGADAVAGVVNFILDDTFTGFRIDGQASVFNHQNGGINSAVQNALSNSFWNTIGIPTPPFEYPRGMSTNGGAQDISAIFGASFDDGRGHVQAYATYRSQDPVLESTRDYSFCALGSFQPQYVASYGQAYCGGSGTSAQGTFFVDNPVTGGTYHVGNGNQLIPGEVLFNYAPYNYYQRPDERYTLGTFANYEIAPGAQPYLEAMFMDDHSDALIAPGGDFGDTLTVNCDNPLLSDQERGIICPGFTFDAANPQYGNVQILRRNVEGGGRDDVLDHNDFRIVAGMRGDPWKGIHYDTYYQYGKSTLNDLTTGFFSKRLMQNAFDVVSVLDGALVAPGTAGATVECRSVLLGTDTNCAPYNIFQQGGVTQAALNYLQVPALSNGTVAETIGHLDVTFTGSDYGLQTPWSDTGIGLNVGVEYRKEALNYLPDLENITGDLSGGSGTVPTVRGQFDVREAFGELQVPIIEHSFIDELSVNGGYRKSSYNVGERSFSTNTYKIEARFAPVRDIRFRASYNRAVRAPNIVELFQPTRSILSGSVDYCAGPDPEAAFSFATPAACALSGVTAAQYGNLQPSPAKQYNAVAGGNVDLNPETADTWTAGVVIQPRFIPGLAVTVDHFNIHVKDVVGNIPWQTILETCLQSGTLCDLIHRDQFGSLWRTPNGFISLQNANVGILQTKGFDFQGTYNHRLGGLGTLNVSFVGTLLKRLYSEFPGSAFDCVGFYGTTCGTPNPEWRHKLRVGLTLPNGIGVSGQWRYFSGVDIDTLSTDTDLNGGSPHSNPFDAHFAAQSYFDLAFTARMGQKLNLRLGVNNVFDRDPPLQGFALGNGNTFPQVYDALGRY